MSSYDMFTTPKKIWVIKTMKWAGRMECMEERGCACRVLAGKPEGKRPLGPRCRWEDN
jgi:hypothetical protein